MKLRPFVPEDRTDFLDMCADFYSGEAALKPIPSAQMKATFDAVISGSPYVRGFILDQDGNAAGYGLVYPFYSNEAGGLCLMLDEIYVRPEFQGRQPVPAGGGRRLRAGGGGAEAGNLPQKSQSPRPL